MTEVQILWAVVSFMCGLIGALIGGRLWCLFESRRERRKPWDEW